MATEGSSMKNGTSAADTRVSISPETDEGTIEETENGSGEDKEDPKKQAARLTSELLGNPQVLAAVQQKLGNMVGKKSGYIDSLPKCVKRRIKALKKLQSKMFDIESKYYEEVHDLECRYASLYTPLFDKRESVINSRVEPTDSECEWTSDEEEEQEEPPKAKIVEIDETKPLSEHGDVTDDAENTKGVPEFWLTIFKNVDLIAALIQENDEPVLKNLLDIRVKYFPSKEMGFMLEFVFGPNEYFTNSVLTKEYRMNSKPNPDEPLGYEGPEIISCKGCKIDWKADKNVTLRKQKHKLKGTKKTVTKMVKVNSFFNFFSPPQAKEDDEDDEAKGLLMIDYEIGENLRSSIVPRAVLYFTGEALEDDDDDDEFEDGDEDGDDDDDDNYNEDEDADYVPPPGSEKGPPECKQQ